MESRLNGSWTNNRKPIKYYIFQPSDPHLAQDTLYVQNFIDGGKKRAAKGSYTYLTMQESTSPLAAVRTYLGQSVTVAVPGLEIYKDQEETWKVGREYKFQKLEEGP